ncbi:hypothetical protein MPDQ_003879 [Monascus purpureus]|uniref:SPRY domain-containing protein n=1 Tax=Monascus purpureus TaxID=5098 RepID=A0A507QM67_MONPU|nr:hypothetical protein MPDQ_003879 [Monascus purpureus]BDD60517.1 hypothetical protein MAP00_005640 [Monascus purpureus]
MADNASVNSRDPPPPYSASQPQPLPGLTGYEFGHYGQTEVSPPPYHNWQEAVPDTPTFSPPPVTSYFCSGTGNASSNDAERAHDYCDRTPLWRPVRPSVTVCSTVQAHDLRPVRPREFHGELSTTGRGKWWASTRSKNGDCILLTHLPLYFPIVDSPLVTEKIKTIYFEIKLWGLRVGPGTGEDASGFSIGFAAQPYPSWRSPGWERGSLGVFSDDGCRFVDDSWGGKEFLAPFNRGDTIGLGMVFSPPASLKETKLPVEVFCTRNGKLEGGWNLYEETDEEAGGVEGLEGDFDLYGAIGFFGGVDLEACFDPTGWLWKPE